MESRALPRIRVSTARGAADADRAAIAAGTPSRALMQRAGAAAAAEIARRFADRLESGVVIATGPGNNGGDGWVVAQALATAGIRARVVECVAARTPDAIAERQSAIGCGIHVDTEPSTLLSGGERIAVDALLGTGVRADRPLEGAIGKAVAALHAFTHRGGVIAALDLPSGVEADSGLHAGAPRCDVTITFGSVKQGLLVAREQAGTIVLVDIGLGVHVEAAGPMRLATSAWFQRMLPPISASAHKGTRKKIAIIGGAEGMAGAAILASRAALRSGAGMVKCLLAPESVLAMQKSEPSVMASAWSDTDDALRAAIGGWADAVLIGPGLGTNHARAIVERTLRVFDGPVVLDADALNAFTGEPEALAKLLGKRQALLTPHPAEFGRLASLSVDDVLDQRFAAPLTLAKRTQATVLLKGVPTTIASPDGDCIAVAAGNPILATGGSGDVLGGIAVTLLAQTRDALLAGALAAVAHGDAAERVSATQVRGFTLEDVIAVLPDVWAAEPTVCLPPVIAEIPAVGERA